MDSRDRRAKGSKTAVMAVVAYLLANIAAEVSGENLQCWTSSQHDSSVLGKDESRPCSDHERCFPKSKDGLNTCDFVKSFGTSVCCCEDAECNTKSCGRSTSSSEKRRELQSAGNVICQVADAGRITAEACQLPFTYTNPNTKLTKTYTSCAPASEAPPYQVKKRGGEDGMWCPILGGLNKGVYNPLNANTRDYWGQCTCFSNADHDCKIGEFQSRYGPVRTGKCSFPFKVVDKNMQTIWYNTCVPLSVVRPFGSDAFNVVDLDGASWCPTETGVNSQGVYIKQDGSKNMQWGLCNQCTPISYSGKATKKPTPALAPASTSTANFGSANALGYYDDAGGIYDIDYDYADYDDTPTKKPTTKKPTNRQQGSNVPTIAPSLAPTLAPANQPTFAPGIDNMDVYVHADMSKSIKMANPVCRKEGGNKCWDLQVSFANDLQARLAAQLGGYYTPGSGSTRGLRYWLSTFTCIKGKPITNVLTQLTGDPWEIDRAIQQMAALKPYLGTCPTQGLTFILDSLRAHFNDPGRTNRAVIIITDGRFDQVDDKSSSSTTRRMLNEVGAEVFAVAVGKGIDMTQLQSVTHDPSGSRIVSIDSFASLAASGPRVANFAVKMFKKPAVGQPTIYSQRPPSPGQTAPSPSDSSSANGEDDEDLLGGGAAGEAAKANTIIIGSAVGFVLAGAAVVGFAWRREARRKRESTPAAPKVITSSLDRTTVMTHSPQMVQHSPSKEPKMSVTSPNTSPASFKQLQMSPAKTPVENKGSDRKAIGGKVTSVKSVAGAKGKTNANNMANNNPYLSKLADPKTWATAGSVKKSSM